MNAAAIRLLVQKGLDAEAIAEVAEALESNSVRSKAAERQARYRARKRENERDSGVTSDVTRDASLCDVTPLPLSPNEINSNPHTPAPGTQTHARVRDEDFPRPDFCKSEQLWRDFKANRRAKCLPCTPTAHARLLRDIARMADDEWPPGRLFEEIVARGWAAAHDPREDRKSNNDRQPPSNRNTAELTRQKLAALGQG